MLFGKTYYFLTGDIGGTNSRMALYKANLEDGTAEPLFIKTYRNSEQLPTHVHDDALAFTNKIVIPFLEYCWNTATSPASPLARLSQSKIIACLAVAGMVSDNRVNLTNLGGLLVDGNAIVANQTNPYLKQIVVCKVINDFVAQGYGCLTLQPEDIEHLYGPTLDQAQPDGPKVCVGAGTGLGECYLTCDGTSGEYTCYPSEGGHTEFAPRNEVELAMLQYLTKRYETSQDRVSIERVVSGPGLVNVYDFLAQHYPDRVDAIVNKEIQVALDDEQPRVVAECAADDANSLCRQAIQIMMNAYGCEVGSAAIKFIPTGGLFVTGGLTPKNMQFIKGEMSDFMQSYLNKGRVASLLEAIPLYAVKAEDLGVRGAYQAAKMEYEHYLLNPSPKKNNTCCKSKGVSASSASLLPLAALAVSATVVGGMMLLQKSNGRVSIRR